MTTQEMKRHGIALNFFPLTTDQFSITCYCSPYVESQPSYSEDGNAVCMKLNIEGEYKRYWTTFQRTKKSRKAECHSLNNIYLTIAALRLALSQSCKSQLKPDEYRIIDSFERGVEIIVNTFQEGSQAVFLEPYYLHSRGKFGILVDFRFHPKEKYRGTRRSLQLSLALDKQGQRNRNYYADRYLKIVDFVSNLHQRIFPLVVPGGQTVQVESKLVKLTPKTLELKNYVVGSEVESHSQFMGVKQSGPLRSAQVDTHMYFLFRQEDRTLSHDLFRALRGDTFNTFPGMMGMFKVPISKDNVHGVVMSDFSPAEIHRVRDQIVADNISRNSNVVPIVLTPFSKNDTPEKNETYWHLKHAFLSKKLPIQVVANETIADREVLKWSVAGIGLQVFAKIGGTPWKVRPQTERCLIVGIGQAHWKVEDEIKRFFAYSVLSDSSGVLKEIRVLGEDDVEEVYIESFGANLRKIFNDYSSEFSNFVVHSTFSIRKLELDRIAEVLTEQKHQSESGEFVALKFNERNRFFGFSVNHNSRVPYESSMVSLSNSEFLVWFEGLQYGQTTPRKMVGNPLHVKFTYPFEKLSFSQQRPHLQDAINLSGANWRGFNAKSLPVSVYYAQLIAKYLKQFERNGLPRVDVNIMIPWFL